MTNPMIGQRVALSALALSTLAQVAAAQNGPLRIGTEGAYPPFNSVNAAGEVEGFDVDVARALCTEMAVECEVVVQDWDGIIPALLTGKYDMIVASMSITDERREVVAFTDPYYRSPAAFIVPAGEGLTNFSPEGLAGAVVGTQGATVHAAYLEEVHPDADIRLYNSIADAYRDLAAGRLEAVLYDKLGANDWLASEEGACCETRGADLDDPAYFGEGVGIAVRQEDEALRLRLNEALAAIVADGTYARINAQYFPFDIF